MGLFSKAYDFTIPEEGISEVEKVTIGGLEQYLLIQGECTTLPVLLFLHGGPSMPLPGVSSRGRDYTVATNTKRLVQEFLVVFWDQRGTGKSYSDQIPAASMNLEQFMSDANEVVDYLRERFVQSKIFLAAHSFGTLIGLNLVHRHPEKFHSYTGLSQIVSWTDNDRLSYEWAIGEAHKRKNKRAMMELQEVGAPPYTDSLEQWGVLRKWQARFGSLVYSVEDVKHPGLLQLMLGMLQSKEYRLKDMYNTFYKGFKLVYTKHFIEQLPQTDIRLRIRDVNIPVTFIHGKQDVHVHGQLLEEYYHGVLKAHQGKRLLWAPYSSHLFHPKDTKWIEQYLIEEKQHLHK